MVNFSNSISFVIQNNSDDSLFALITSLNEQNQNLNYQINFIVLSSKKPLEKDNLLTNIVERLQSVIDRKITRFNGSNSLIYARYEDLTAIIKSDLTIFVCTKYIPQAQWLESIVSQFSNPQIQIVAGGIIESNDRQITTNRFDSLCLDTPEQYLQAWQKQTANLAVRTEFFHQLNSYSLGTNNQNRDACFCRILRELESEIVYLPQAKVALDTR